MEKLQLGHILVVKHFAQLFGITLVLLTSLASACTSPPIPTATPTSSLTPTFTPSPTWTASPTATAPASPTAAPSPSVTPTAVSPTPRPSLTTVAAAPTALPPPAATPTAAPPPPRDATFTIGGLHYSEDGRQAFMNITVTNHRLEPAVASGNWYPIRQANGDKQWVTLLKAEHEEVPIPIIKEDNYGLAPLWEFQVTTNDGLIFLAYAGCDYSEEIYASGFEPQADGGYFWELTLEDGWFRCGRDNDPMEKPDHDLRPGESATVPLRVWIVHPRTDAEDASRRRIVRLEFMPRAPDGTSFGVQDVQIVPRQQRTD